MMAYNPSSSSSSMNNKMTPHMAMQVGLAVTPAEMAGMGFDGNAALTDMMMVKKPNTLPTWGNVNTMNLNPLIHTNIETSPYYSGRLSELKTYHELVDEIYYKVKHLEPWEKGSRNAGGRRQTGMCGGVRGVGMGGIISSAFCILYRLFTLRLTRKQLYGLLNHPDSPYIRGLGFLYVRFSQPPNDFWEWFEPYIDDPEEVDARAGGGQIMTIGEVVRHLITRQDWFSTLFPRIPVPIQIQIDKRLAALKHATSVDPTPKPQFQQQQQMQQQHQQQEASPSRFGGGGSGGEYGQETSRSFKDRDSRGGGGGGGGSGPSSSPGSGSSSKRHHKHHRSPRSRSRSRSRSRDKDRDKSKKKHKKRTRTRSRSRSPKRESKSKRRSRSRDRDSSSKHHSDKHRDKDRRGDRR